MPAILIRKAKMGDVKAIHSLLNFYAERRQLLPRSLAEVYENLQQFFVAVKKSKVVGVCALYVTWNGLAEVKALAVAESEQGKGLGKRLLKTIVAEAKKLDVHTLFTLTIREELFKKFGFKRAKKSALPHKVWTECLKCPYFPEACIETSLTLDLVKKKGPEHRDVFTDTFMSTAEPMVPSEPRGPILTPPLPPDHR